MFLEFGHHLFLAENVYIYPHILIIGFLEEHKCIFRRSLNIWDPELKLIPWRTTLYTHLLNSKHRVYTFETHTKFLSLVSSPSLLHFFLLQYKNEKEKYCLLLNNGGIFYYVSYSKLYIIYVGLHKCKDIDIITYFYIKICV